MERIIDKAAPKRVAIPYQKAINERDRVPNIEVDGMIREHDLNAAEETARIMGVSPYKGSIKAALRRQAVIMGAPRTRTELNRAKKIKAAAEKAAKGPTIVNLKLTFPGPGQSGYQGLLGSIAGSVGHYSGGPRDKSDAHAYQLWRQYHAFHRSKGWGGEGYHFGITASGKIVLLRPVKLKGTHVAGYNTGRIGINMHGTTGDKPTLAQQEALRWLLLNAHTSKMPASHRTPTKLDGKKVWGHNDLNSTSCPGSFKKMYINHGRTR